MNRTLRILLALVVLAACRNPTAPAPTPISCSLTLPTGQFVCWKECPPGTAEWARGAGLPYASMWQC